MGRKLALLIGSRDYRDPKFRRLAKPDADVAALERVLREATIGAFDEVIASVDEDSAAIRRRIARLFASRSDDDLLLLFFAGHGVKDEFGKLHLAVADTDADLLSATSVSADFIAREMDRSRSRRQLLILDCCFSGAFSGTRGGEAANVGTAEPFSSEGKGRVILTATDSFQYSWENEEAIAEQNSVFTHFLVKGLETGKADLNEDGQVTADEWYEYVYHQVRAVSPKQTPQRSVYEGAGSIVVANNPRPAIPLPEEMTIAIKSPLPYVRQGAVHELARLLKGSHKGLSASARDALERMANDVDALVSNLARETLLEPARSPMHAETPAKAPLTSAAGRAGHGGVQYAPERNATGGAEISQSLAQEKPAHEPKPPGRLASPPTSDSKMKSPGTTLRRDITAAKTILMVVLIVNATAALGLLRLLIAFGDIRERNPLGIPLGLLILILSTGVLVQWWKRFGSSPRFARQILIGLALALGLLSVFTWSYLSSTHQPTTPSDWTETAVAIDTAATDTATTEMTSTTSTAAWTTNPTDAGPTGTTGTMTTATAVTSTTGTTTRP